MRAAAFLLAITVGIGLGVLAVVIGSPFYSYLLGIAAGAIVVLANVLTHPHIVNWR